ncbi:MAG: hypothetical protein ACI8RZ_004798 [Myxococcota bacterium]|jgi:hypothetical protein
MSTYSASLRFQTPIAVEISTGTFGSTEVNQDVQVTIPVDWDHFWENTRSDFFDVVLTDVDGTTKLTFARVGPPDHGSRVLTLNIQDWDAPSGKAVCLLWLHYGDSSAATDPAPGATVSSPLTASITLAKPGGWLATHSAPRSGRNQDVWTKRSTEIRDLWVRFPGMAQRRSKSRGVVGLEWLSYVKIDLFDATPTAQPSLSDLGRFRFVGSQFVRVDLRAGLSGTTYAVTVTATTNLGQRLVYPASLQVLDS